MRQFGQRIVSSLVDFISPEEAILVVICQKAKQDIRLPVLVSDNSNGSRRMPQGQSISFADDNDVVSS